MKHLSLSICFLVLSLGLRAQKTITSTYQYTLPGSIEMIEKVPGGILLVGTSEGLSGLEAHSDKVLYTYTKMGKIKAEELTIVPNTSYITLTRGYSKVVLDYTTGKEAFAAADDGWAAIMSVTPDFTNGTMALMGTTSKGYALGIYDMFNFSKKGMIVFDNKETMGGYINALTYFESDGKLFVRTEKGIVCIDKAKISIDWVYSELDKTSNIIKVAADAAKGEYYVCESNMSKHYLHKLDAKGILMTKKPTKLPAMPQNISLVGNHVFTHTADLKTTYYQLYDRTTALPVWKKPCEVSGAIFFSEITSSGLVYAAQNGGINIVDLSTGLTKLKKDIKTGPMFQNVSLLDNNQVFYLTSKDMGVADLNTGAYIKEPTKFKKVTQMISSFDEKNNRLIVSTGTELYFIKTDGTSQKITDIAFEEDESPNKIEFRASGILIGAAQNNMLVSYDGKIIYQSYFKAPGQSIAGKIALGALAMAAASSNQSMMNQGYKGDGSAAAGMENEMKKKFKATSGTKDHLYILTKLDDGVGLVKINKDTGAKEAELVLKDKKPEYRVDEQYGILFYKKEDKQVVGFDLR
jgi:hypothetical protein